MFCFSRLFEGAFPGNLKVFCPSSKLGVFSGNLKMYNVFSFPVI